jgi:phage recombination protein Bet
MSEQLLDGPPAGRFADDGYQGVVTDVGPEFPAHQFHVENSGGALVNVDARLPMPVGVTLPPEQWRVLTDAIWPSAKTPGAIKLALDYCTARRLDPFKRPVHIVPMWNSKLKCEVETVWPAISELQTTAARTGEWAGLDEPRWGPDIERTFTGRKKRSSNNGRDEYVDVSVTLTYPEWCIVTVYRMVKGVRCAFSEPVYWLEAYAPTNKWCDVPNEMWCKRTRGQHMKCAKAAALRAAFPEELGNTYSAEEMEGKDWAGGVEIPGTAEEVEEESHGNKGKSKLDAIAERAAKNRPPQAGAANESGKPASHDNATTQGGQRTQAADVDQRSQEKERGDGKLALTPHQNGSATGPSGSESATGNTSTAASNGGQSNGGEAKAREFADEVKNVLRDIAKDKNRADRLADYLRVPKRSGSLARLKAAYPAIYREVIELLSTEVMQGMVASVQSVSPSIYDDVMAKVAQRGA